MTQNQEQPFSKTALKVQKKTEKVTILSLLGGTLKRTSNPDRLIRSAIENFNCCFLPYKNVVFCRVSARFLQHFMISIMGCFLGFDPNFER